MLAATAELALSDRPDRMLMLVEGLSAGDAEAIAAQAVRQARRTAPKLTGAMAKRLAPLWGEGYFGIYFPDSVAWYQEHGIRAFTMTNLAGKTVPMWITDATGVERQKNPKAKVRTTASGKIQVQIFRRVGVKGQLKATVDKRTGVTKMVGMHPGAPGRIGVRQAGKPMTTPGKVAGAIAKGNVGVKWRHPGLAPRMYLNNAVTLAAQWNGILPIRIYVADATTDITTRHHR